jgi:polar amino acid transport system substrate-binding protein
VRDGSVAAVAQDHHTLARFLAAAPDRGRFKILPTFLTEERVGIGIAKHQKEPLDAVNVELLELEQSGAALRTTTNGSTASTRRRRSGTSR